jgi:DNA-binding transcriptional LysR family regulator
LNCATLQRAGEAREVRGQPRVERGDVEAVSLLHRAGPCETDRSSLPPGPRSDGGRRGYAGRAPVANEVWRYRHAPDSSASPPCGLPAHGQRQPHRPELFVVLDAIYTEGGITRASERLALTQPAISHALARLRELVGDPLFVREGHAMMPTAAAHTLIGPVRRALKEIEGSLNQLQAFDPATSTRAFRIGMRHIVESAALPDLAMRVRAAAPQVQLAAVHHDRDALHGALATGELDAVVDVLLPRVPHVSYQRLAGGKMVVAVRAGHPAVGASLDLPTYLALDHVMASSRPQRAGPGRHRAAASRPRAPRGGALPAPLDGLPAWSPAPTCC